MLLQNEKMEIAINEQEKTYLHKKDIAKIFGFGRDKTKRLLESGILPVIKMNRDYIISPRDLDRWLKKNIGRELNF